MVGDRIKVERDKRSWSQSELSRRSGVAQAYISQVEAGERTRIGADILQR